MNENINLCEILKDCPHGTKFYSSTHGTVTLNGVRDNKITVLDYRNHPIDYSKDGRYCPHIYGKGECTIFPSKDQRDWSKFTAPWYNKPIEQKFRVGQYITDGQDSGQITEVDCHCYKILDFTGNTNIIIPFTLQDNYHLWTIQDAKYGDVLALSWMEDENLFEKIIIFKKYHNEGVKGLYNGPCVEGYGNTFMNGKLLFTDEKVPYFSKTWSCDLHPATKEQRDRLFQRVKEAGYEWNVETKTLEKRLKYKFNYKTLKPFDRVLVRDSENGTWECELFSRADENLIHKFKCCGLLSYRYCIPYNDDTNYLIGTTEEAPEFYCYWKD